MTAEKFLAEAPPAPPTDGGGEREEKISSTACDTISHMLKASGDAGGMRFEFVSELDRLLREHGFVDVSMWAAEKRRQDYKGWTEDYLMVWEGIAEHFPPKATVPEGVQVPMTRESRLDLFDKAVHETEQGVAIHQGKIMIVVGRKPT